MAKGREVMEMLIPTGGWVIYGDDFDSIRYDDGVTPITKKQFDNGFAQVDVFKAEQQAKAEADKVAAQAKLEALGLTSDDLKALGL
jgi:hypothetical protein